jgi:hypothetical protein
MSAERHIVSLQNKNTRQAKNMIAIITNNLPVIILPIIMPVVWAGFATYTVWRARVCGNTKRGMVEIISRALHNPKRNQGKPGKSKQRNLAETCGVVEKLGGGALFPQPMETSPEEALY